MRAACRRTTATAVSWSSRLGTAYFGCRDEHGRFSLDRLKDLVAGAPVRALEIKLSQGAKPSLGGLLPGAKVSAEIAATRGIPAGQDCVSPSRHAEFSDCRQPARLGGVAGRRDRSAGRHQVGGG